MKALCQDLPLIFKELNRYVPLPKRKEKKKVKLFFLSVTATDT